MLTGDLLRTTRRKGRVQPHLVDPTDPVLLERARGLIAEVQAHQGKRRGDLEEALELFAPAGPAHAIERGLAKLLEDRSTFEVHASADPRALRSALFDRSASAWRTHSLDQLPQWREQVLAEGAAAVGISPQEAEEAMYADLEANEILVAADLPSPQKLLERYNVALVQGLLLRADTLGVRASWPDPARLRQLFRWLKFFGLLFQLGRDADGTLTLRVDGPLSILEHANRYGLNFAQFFAALLLWPQGWQLTARVRVGRRAEPSDLVLVPHPWLRSPLPDHGAWVPDAVRHFIHTFAGHAGPWRAAPAEQVVQLPDNAYLIPDLEFVGADGRRILLEHVQYPTLERIQRVLALAEQAPRMDSAPPIGKYVIACKRSDELPSHALLLPYRRTLLASQVRQKLDELSG